MHEMFGAGALSAKLLCKHSQVTFMRNVFKDKRPTSNGNPLFKQIKNPSRHRQRGGGMEIRTWVGGSVSPPPHDYSPQSSSSWGASWRLSLPVTSSSDPQSSQAMISPSSVSAARVISAPQTGHSAIFHLRKFILLLQGAFLKPA